MFEGLTPTHLILILVVVLVLFGPGKLPEVGSSLGRGIREFRNAAQGKDEPAPARPSSVPTSGQPVAPAARASTVTGSNEGESTSI